MNRISKIFLLGLAVVALAGFGKIGTTNAAATPGSLIKMNGLSSVYYLGQDGKRYVFPAQNIYFSWYKDFSGVVTISQSELESYPLGANITMRPGTRLVKITTNPKVYAVEPGGNLRAIPDEATAKALYGDNWNKRVSDVADAFFTNYKMGNQLASNEVPAGSLVKNAGDASVYYFDGTNYRSIANEAAFNANRFSFDNVMTISNTITAGGTAITANEFANPDASATGIGTIPGQGTGLTVALSASTPASANVPQNGVRVPFAKVNLTAASDGVVAVNSITVKRIGLSNSGDIDKVWAEQNGIIVASKKSMNSNDESILVFSPTLNIPAGQTVALELLASLTGTGTGNIGLSVTSASAVNTNGASVTGSFPINGNLMSLVNYQVAKLAITGTNTSSSPVKVGDENVELGHFDLGFNTNAVSAKAKDVSVISIMLKNNGVEDLSKTAMNLYLEHAGAKITSSYSINGRFITFSFNNGFELLKDDGSKMIYLKGDIIAKENTGTNSYAFELNKSTDLVAYEKSTGFGVNTYNTSSGTSLADALQISAREIEAGAVSVSKKATSPSATTIVKGTDHVVLLANIRADEQINADGMKIWHGSASGHASTTDQFENVRVFLNGVLLDSFDPSASTTAQLSVNIDSSLTLNKGDNEVKVMVKAKSNANSGSAFLAKLSSDIFSGMNPEYVVSGNSVSSVSGSATGAEFTVEGAALTTVRNDGYANNKAIVRGSSDVSLGKFTVKASNDVVRVTSVSLGENEGATTSTLPSSISDMKLFVDNVQVAGPVNFGTSGSNFSSLNISIAKDTTKSFEIKGSFDSAAEEDSYFKTKMTINAQDSRGTSIATGHQAYTTQFQVKAAGSLNIERGGDSPVDGLLASKNTEQEVAQFKFTAINDSANLTEINIVNWDGSAATSSADSRIAAFKLYDGATMIDQFVPVNGGGKFTIANNSVVVPANGQKTLSIRVNLNNIENDADATNKDLQVRITSAKFKSSAGNESTSTSTNINAYSFRIRKTVPTIAYQVLPDTLLNAGDKVIAKFTVTADANADVTVGRFTLLTSKTASSTLATTTNGLKVNGANKTATQTLDSNNLTVLLATPEVVAAGTTKTFEVIATVGVSGNGSESITAKIVEDTAYDTETGSLTSGLEGSFAWSDGAYISAYTWAGSKNISGLDTNTWTLSKN